MHGREKTTAAHAAIYHFLSLKLNVLVVCPTGFSASTYKAEFGDSITSNTLHSSFNTPIDLTQPSSMNWSLINFYIVVIDKIFMISLRNSDHVFECLHSPSIFPLLILCGDKFQLQPFQTADESSQLLPSFFENAFFLGNESHFLLLTKQHCCNPALNSFLCLIRHFNVTNRDIFKRLSSLSFTDHTKQVGAETIIHAFDANMNTIFLTFTKDSSRYINSMIAQHIFSNDVPLTHVYLSTDLEARQPIFKNMKIMITENKDKEKGVINGTIAFVRSLHNQTPSSNQITF